jgi:AcrR family transcriptional regulator
VSARPRINHERQNQILEAAAQVIAQRGLSETRIVDIAEQAGTSAALIIYYFDSKDRLLTEALAFAEDRFYLYTFHQLTEIESARGRLERLIELSFPPGRDGAGGIAWDWTLWLELWSKAVRHEGAARKREALDRRWRSTISDIIRSGIQNGEFKNVDADEFAVHLSTLLDGLAIQLVLDDGEVTATRARALCYSIARHDLGLEARFDSDGLGDDRLQTVQRL